MATSKTPASKTKKSSTETKTSKKTKSEKPAVKKTPSKNLSATDKKELALQTEKMSQIVKKQREYFISGATLPIPFRKRMLDLLYKQIKLHQKDIAEALKRDLGKSNFEAYATEIGIVLSEISHQKKNIRKWSKAKKVSQPISNFPSSSKIFAEPYGVTLIMSPWNYPFQLAINPLVTAIAAGNTAIVKPSRYSTYTSRIIEQIITKIFDPQYIAVVQGGHIQNQALLAQHFDFIFFTGSVNVGKIVMEKAAQFLTPVCLELGGKSPCIVDQTADIKIAARRIVWGKCLNAGQTCIAPDYLLVHESVKKQLLANINDELTAQFGENPLKNSDFPKIINEKHFTRLLSLYPQAVKDKENLKIKPAFVDIGELNSDEANNHPLMSQEIFGPLMPVITFNDINNVIKFINSKNRPLALYLFSTNKNTQSKIISQIRYGGGCINDTITHILSNNLPFGGIGESGMGSYHGKAGFDTFTHYKSVVNKSNLIDISTRYAPYYGKLSIIKKFLH